MNVYLSHFSVIIWIERNKSTTYAKKLNEKIKERTNLLKQNPDLGKKTDFNNRKI